MMKFKIENYENMTAEEKVAALEAYEPDMSGFVTKAQLDKVASEAASYKKKLREKMTAEEEKAAREAEERTALQQRVEELERERTIHNYTTSFLTMGYGEALAKETAEALVSGEMDRLAERQLPDLSSHIETMKIMTARDYSEFTHMKKSSFGGVVPIRGQKNPTHKTPIKGLWFVGQQSENAGGLGNVIGGAKAAYEKAFSKK